MIDSKAKREELIASHQPEQIEKRLQQPVKPMFLSDAILGSIDGCVTTFAIVSGVVGAGFSSSVALILGVANLFADGFSMAVSNYEAIQSQKDHIKAIEKTEQHHIEHVPDGEREEIRQIYRRKGFAGDVLEQIVETICEDRKLWVETMLTEEYDLRSVNLNPVKSGLITFSAFVIVGSVPLIPFLFLQLEIKQQFILSSCLAGLIFFSIGTIKSIILSKPVLLSGIQTFLTGSAAASLAFIIGYVLREAFGITL